MRNWPQRNYSHTTENVCQICGSELYKMGEKCNAIGQECYHCGRIGHFSKICSRNPNNPHKTDVNHIDTEQQSPDDAQSEYTAPYYITNDPTKIPIQSLKMTAKVYHICNTDTEHIRLLWIAESQGSQIHQADCEIDMGAGCNVLPAHKAWQLFGQE